MANYELKRYEEQPGDYRLGVEVTEGEVYILCISANKSTLEIHHVRANSFWREGCQEYVSVHKTMEEAMAYRDIYPETQLPDEVSSK